MAAEDQLNKKMEIETAGGTVSLSPNDVRNYLVSGDAEKVTIKEVMMFLNLCKFNGLNPWLKEAYCIKYGSSPATMVVGKEAYLKRAETDPAYDGMEAGIIVLSKDGAIENRVGTFHTKEEPIYGGWARVWRKDRSHPVTIEVSFDEYAGRTKDGQLNSQWRSKPATMIRKVALVQALREAFPGNIEGLYEAEEMSSQESQDIEVESKVMDPLASEKKTEEPAADDFEEYEEIDIDNI